MSSEWLECTQQKEELGEKMERQAEVLLAFRSGNLHIVKGVSADACSSITTTTIEISDSSIAP